MNKKFVLSATVIAAASIAVAGCGKGASTTTSVPDNGVGNEPITLSIYTQQGNYVTEKDFNDQIGDFITKKFPNVTIQHILKAKNSYDDLVAQGTTPDIILEGSSNVSKLISYGYQLDLAPYIDKTKFSLNRIDPALLQQIKNSGDGKLYGLPFYGDTEILFYNKDIFDKFGVAYPKDNMTWDQVYELAKSVTRQDQGNQYYGFTAYPGIQFKYNQLSIPWLDTNNQATVETDKWKELFSNLSRFAQLQGGKLQSVDDFPKSQIAMDLHVESKVFQWPQQATGLNWDVAATPTFPDAPQTGFQSNEYSLFVTSASPHKDAAFAVVSYLLSDEVQTALSKKGYVTPLVNKEVQKVIGQDNPGLTGKNLFNAVFTTKYAQSPKIGNSDLYGTTSGDVTAAFNTMITNNADLNTTLRQLTDSLNKKADAAKAAGSK
ncbi:MAG: transporter substrate-binding protein [Bacilli bacterium]|nr:transporter substrate-binding protein [Bacilli bacterium]